MVRSVVSTSPPAGDYRGVYIGIGTIVLILLIVLIVLLIRRA